MSATMELHGGVDEKALATLAAAAEPTRLTILFLLGQKGRMCVGDIAKRFKASRPAISHHLKVLKNCNLVEAEREGQEIYYSVQTGRDHRPTAQPTSTRLLTASARRAGGGWRRKMC